MSTNLRAILESMMRGIHAEMTKDIRSHRPSYEGLGLVEKTELRTIALKQLEDAGFFKKQEAPSEPHDLVIGAGDEELWIRCSCGWVVNPSPWPQTKPLEEAWEAWYWPHAIKEHIKQEERS